MAKLRVGDVEIEHDPRTRVTVEFEKGDVKKVVADPVEVKPRRDEGLKKSTQQLLAFVFGVVFLIAVLALAVFIPNPTPFQYTVFRIVLALAAGGVAAMIPGFIRAEVPKYVQAGGALAVFVIVFFFSPAALVVNP